MGWIILGLLMQGIGTGLLIAFLSSTSAKISDGAALSIVLLLVLVVLAGIVALLGGLKKFFLDDVIETLHDIKDKLLLFTTQNGNQKLDDITGTLHSIKEKLSLLTIQNRIEK